MVSAAMNASYSRPVPNCCATTTLRTRPSTRLATSSNITVSEAAASFLARAYIGAALPGPAADGPEVPGPGNHGLVGALLEPVVERRQANVVAVAPAQRPLDQVVGEPGIFRQQRTMQ